MAQASLKTVKACQEKIVTGTEEIDALRKKLEKLLQKKPKWVNCTMIAEVYLWWSAEIYEYFAPQIFQITFPKSLRGGSSNCWVA